MHRRLKVRTRTLLLIALAVVVSAQGLSLFLSTDWLVRKPSHQNELDFLLQVDGEPGGMMFLEGARPKLLQFDPVLGSWMFDDQPLSEFASHVEGLEIGPHGSSPFVIIALPGEPTLSDYQKAIASLARHGICRVGVYAPMSNQGLLSLRTDRLPSGNTFVPLYRVLNVRLDTGVDFDCVDRFPAWALPPVNRE